MPSVNLLTAQTTNVTGSAFPAMEISKAAVVSGTFGGAAVELQQTVAQSDGVTPDAGRWSRLAIVRETDNCWTVDVPQLGIGVRRFVRAVLSGVSGTTSVTVELADLADL